MTDMHYTSGLLAETDDTPATASWNTIMVALAAIFLVLAATYLTGQSAGDTAQLQSSETGNAKLDGRGKWIGYM